MSVIVEPALLSFLKADQGLTSKIASRIWPAKSPQGQDNSKDVTFPRVIYQRLDTDRIVTTNGPCPPTSATFKLVAQGTGKNGNLDAKQVADFLYRATGGAPAPNSGYNWLQGFKGLMGAAPNQISVQGAFLNGDTDDFLPPAHDGDVGVYTIDLTLVIWFTEL